MSENFAADFYGCPSFFIQHAAAEIFGTNVRVYHWERRGSILSPAFIAIVPAQDLAIISADTREAAKKSLATGWQDLVGIPHH